MSNLYVGLILAYLISWLITATILGAFCFVIQFYLNDISVIIPALALSPLAVVVILLDTPLLLLLGLISAIVHIMALRLLEARANSRPRNISIFIGGCIGLMQLLLSPFLWDASDYSDKQSAMLTLGIPMLCGCLCSGFILGRAYEETD